MNRVNQLDISALEYIPRIQARRTLSLLSHPATLFCGTWGIVVILYDLHLSRLLMFDSREVTRVVAYIFLPFIVTSILTSRWMKRRGKTGRGWMSVRPLNFDMLRRRVRFLFWAWAFLTGVEVAVSSGIPILWLLSDSSKTYFDFGIPSIHGLLNSLLLALSLISAFLYLETDSKSDLLIPGFTLVWPLLVISRNLFIVNIAQLSVLWILRRGIKFSTLVRMAAVIAVVVLIFGLVGDFRTGADSFSELAQPSANYPEWLPSGVLWAYIYAVTPINNLLNTVSNWGPTHDFNFKNSASLLFPSLIRSAVYGDDELTAVSGDLVSEAFNVSTAYVGPFQDAGLLGIVVFSVLIAFVGTYFWHARNARDLLIYSVWAQCLIFSVFYNHFLYLPVVTQTIWIHFLVKQRNRSR